MKKFLSLLSLLTISGSSLLNIIAASLYQKEEIKSENIGKRQKQNNNENNKINKTKIVITINDEVSFF